MSDQNPPGLPEWPFYLGDLLLLGVAGLIYWQGDHAPWQGHLRFFPWEAWALVACVIAAAVLGVLPHLLAHRAATRVAEAQHLDHALLQVQNIEAVARQITGATANWQGVQDDATKAVQSAREIAESIATEARAFQDFLAKANETEKSHLRLEVEKLRRAEGEWLQVLTWILDHTYAIYMAALRSGQPGLTEQLNRFQRASHDAARRVGLVPFAVPAGEAYDPKAHQLADPQAPLPAEPVIAETIGLGIRFQGRVVRQPAVTLRGVRDERSDLSLRDINQRREQIGLAAPLAGAGSAPEPEPVADDPSAESPGAETSESVPGSETLPESQPEANGEPRDGPGRPGAPQESLGF
jgi:hypothetical protein